MNRLLRLIITKKQLRNRYADNWFWLAFSVFFLLSFGNAYGQESVSSEDSVTVESIPFALSEIPNEFNALSNRLIEISEVIQADERILNNDLVVKEYSTLLETSKQEIMTKLPSMTYQRLENLIRAWHNYERKLVIFQGTLKSRISEIESVKSELDEELQRWDKMAGDLEQNELPGKLSNDADTVLIVINLAIANTIERSDALLLIRARQTQLSLLIDEMIRIMEEEQKAFQTNYFIIDSNPIWNSSDSTTQFQNVTAYLKGESTESYHILKIYLRSNRGIVFLQLVFIIALIVGFILISRIWPTHELNPDSKRETQADYIIRHPFFSSLLISIFFYTNRPLVLGDFFVTFMMISSLVLLPGLLTRKIKILLILLLALFLLNILQDYLPSQSLSNRLIIFIQSIATLGLLFMAYKIKSEFELKSLGERVITGFIGVFGLLMIVALGSNMIGSVKLADFLIS